MTLQIDTDFKIIKVLHKVTIRELITELAKLFPEEAFMEYTLDIGPAWNEGGIIYDHNAFPRFPLTSPSITPFGTPIYGTSQPTSITEIINNIK